MGRKTIRELAGIEEAKFAQVSLLDSGWDEEVIKFHGQDNEMFFLESVGVERMYGIPFGSLNEMAEYSTNLASNVAAFRRLSREGPKSEDPRVLFKGMKIVEIGYGPDLGTMHLPVLEAMGAEVLGYDICPTADDLAKKSGFETVPHCLENIAETLPTGFMPDLIVSSNTYHPDHLQIERSKQERGAIGVLTKSIEESSKVLAPNGAHIHITERPIPLGDARHLRDLGYKVHALNHKQDSAYAGSRPYLTILTKV